MGYVPQKPTLIPGTIRENFKWSKEDITDDEIIEILQRTDCLSFMNKLEDGLDTEIGNIGDKLSGGQIQRLCLARALGKKPNILILDEPTSSLDKDTADKIINEIEQLKDIKTIFLITHKIENLKNADRIFKLEENSLIKIK